MTFTLHRQRYLTQDDSIRATNLPPGVPAYAGYVDGIWADYDAICARFPGAQVLSIAVFVADNADCLDIETGDATPGQAPAWTKRQHRRGLARPCLYASAGIMNLVHDNLTAAGLPRSSYRLWSAHYGSGPHICGPDTCKLVKVACDGTQWTDAAPGVNGSKVDESLLADNFFAGDLPADAEDDMEFWLEHGKHPVSLLPGKTTLRFFDGEKRDIEVQWAGAHTEKFTLDGMKPVQVTAPAGVEDAMVTVAGLGGSVCVTFR